MTHRWFLAIIVLLAAAIASVVFLIQGMDINEMAIRLLVVIAVFFVFGSIIQSIIKKMDDEVNKRKTEADEDERRRIIEDLLENESMRNDEENEIDDETTFL